MTLQNVTVQDCMDMCRYKNKLVLISDGNILGFEQSSEDDIEALTNTIKQERVEKLKKWLSWWAADFKERQKQKNFVDGTIVANTTLTDIGVPLYKGLRNIAEILGLPCEGNLYKTSLGKKLRVSFVWDGVEFFQWENYDA